MVFAPELLADFRQRGRGELLHEEHGDLARVGNHFRVAANFQVLRAQAKDFADGFLDLLDGNFLFLRLDDVAEHLLRRGEIQFGAGERGVGHQANQRSFKLADVRFDRAGDEFGHVVGNVDALIVRLLLQNGDFRFQIRHLDIGDQAPFEAGTQAFFDRGNFLRRAIG